MGKRGPKPKSTFVRRLEGNPSGRALNDAEPTCDLPAIKPAFVAADEIASREWDRAVAAMPIGIYTALDVATLTMYALSWSLMARAQRDIDSTGAVIFGPRGPMPSPAVKVWKGAVDALFKAADRLGLHPGARVALKIPERNAAPSKWDGLINIKPLRN